MTTAASLAANPFALMVQPDAVLRAMEKSSALRGLRQQQFRPLDREEELAAEAAAAAKSRQSGRSTRPAPAAADGVDTDTAPWLRGIASSDIAIYSSLLN
ncbi:hypothetical protein [Xylophilus sp.]|uniref:hypothetical protein n=1 Tax=Xylophilus sp. TaxID=2653893 RepID=UPI0013BC0AF1|nr:hypothetical protein [Xylophilus sp.]KAF1043884.1 MAG: hypothetical protein GAK38_03771 [Xylophilus sp.]